MFMETRNENQNIDTPVIRFFDCYFCQQRDIVMHGRAFRCMAAAEHASRSCSYMASLDAVGSAVEA
jgi:hypothetical protein